jgi:hypothetical protein
MILDCPRLLPVSAFPEDAKEGMIVALEATDGDKEPGLYAYHPTLGWIGSGSGGGVKAGDKLPAAKVGLFLLLADDGAHKQGLYVCYADTWTALDVQISPEGGLLRTGTGLSIARGFVPYDITGSHQGRPGASAVVSSIVILRSIYVDKSLSGSYAEAKVAATVPSAYRVVHIAQNGTSTEIGRFTFAAGAKKAAFSGPGSVTKYEGPARIEVIAPVSADATLADVAFGIAASLLG